MTQEQWKKMLDEMRNDDNLFSQGRRNDDAVNLCIAIAGYKNTGNILLEDVLGELSMRQTCNANSDIIKDNVNRVLEYIPEWFSVGLEGYLI